MDAVIVLCICIYFIMSNKAEEVPEVDIPEKGNPTCYEDKEAFTTYVKLLLK